MLDADAQKDVGGGDVDPRMIALLDKLTKKHKIELSVIKTGHPQFTTGGSVSNHFEGRGIDIARVDGEIVNAGSPAARELASEIANMTGDLRPTEVGTPFQIGAEGFFTDGDHQDHLHVAFDGEPPAGFQPPAPAAPVAPAATAAAAPGQPAAAAAAPEEPKYKKGDSFSFKAVTAEDAAHKPKAGDSGAFMAVQPPAGPAHALAAPGTAPAAVADAATATASGSSSLGASALEVAKQELAKGVHETGTNTGAQVDEYLKAADVGPGNPWCASFVTWALEKSGHKMDGTGWAAVQTWVRNAEAGNNNLEVVSAADARPGDIVAYDWGGQEDFASDGHIGFLASKVEGDKFTAVEGNYQDAVLSVPRQMGDANVKFIRIKGEAAAGAPAPSATPLVGPTAQGPAQAGSDVPAPSGGTPPASSNAVTPSGDGAAGAAADAAAPGGGEAGPKALKAIEEAKKYLGTDYHWGGSTPETGFDCSGLMQWAYAQAGIKLPRVTYDQIDVGTAVKSQSDLKPGDLIFFGDADAPHHVAMSLGGRQVPARAEHWRRGQGLEPRRAVLQEPVRRRAADRRRGARRRSGARGRHAGAGRPGGRRGRGRQGAGRRGPRRRRGPPPGLRAVHGRQGAGGAQAQGDGHVHEGRRPEARQGLRRACGLGRRGAGHDTRGAGRPEHGPAARRPGAGQRARARRRRPGRRLPGRPRVAGRPREVARRRGEEGGAPARAAGHGLARRVRRQERQGRRRRLGRLLPDARRDLGLGPYKGYRQNPNLQAKWFIDQALAVKRNKIAAGNANFGKDPGAWGEWIADIERPAAQYRGRYQLRLDEARRLLGGR